MPLWAHRTTFQVLPSIAEGNLPEPVANYVEEPDLAPVEGFPVRYWSLAGDTFSLVDQATRDAIDAALLVAQRDSTADIIDSVESYEKAFALIVMDELNILRALHGLPDRTPAQLKNALRARMNT